jgi:tubulin polyglutamylase TTLL6/13
LSENDDAASSEEYGD